jgi:hypothetical protein
MDYRSQNSSVAAPVEATIIVRRIKKLSRSQLQAMLDAAER